MEKVNQQIFCLEVWGDYACFTRPEMKVERVSYDAITPSAARAIFEAILWKPAVRWHIRKIEVINPVKWISVRRNEIASTMSERSKNGIFIEDKGKRQQKAGLFLKDVKYRLHAFLEFLPPEKRVGTPVFPKQDNSAGGKAVQEHSKDETPGKYLGMFERRAKKGQCFNQPYLGCREFSCNFRLIENFVSEPDPWQESYDLGFMLYDLDFEVDVKKPPPVFFRAVMENGIITVPDRGSGEVYR